MPALLVLLCRHRRLGRDVRPGEGRGRDLSAVRVPGAAVRDRERDARRAAAPRGSAALGSRTGSAPACSRARCSAPATRCRRPGSSGRRVSLDRLHHRHVRRADAAARARRVPDPGRRAALARRRARHRAGSRCSRASTAARLLGDLLVLAGRRGLLAADRADGALRAALRRARVHARRDARRRSPAARDRARARRPAGPARLDGLGRAARHRRLRERARVPRPDVGAAADDARRARRSRSRSSRCGRRSSASRSPATGSARPAGSAAP